MTVYQTAVKRMRCGPQFTMLRGQQGVWSARVSAPRLTINRSTVPLRTRVVERLRTAICEQRLPQGTRLVERQLCEMLGVSRTLVREALRQLEAEGLVVSVAHAGPSVAMLERNTVRSIYEVRAVLEALAGKLFVERATESDRRKLGEAFEALRLAWRNEDPAKALRATARFYDVLFAGARNEVIAFALRPLSGRIYLLRARSIAMPGRRQQSLDEMQAILEAAQGSDPERAWRCCLVHVQRAATYALQSFDGSTPTGPRKKKSLRNAKDTSSGKSG